MVGYILFECNLSKPLNGSFWLAVEKFNQWERRCLKPSLRTKWITLTVPENGVGNSVIFCLRLLGPFEKCVLWTQLSDEALQPELPQHGFFFWSLQVWSGDTLIPGWCPLGHGRWWKQVSPVFSLVPLHLVRYPFINSLGGTMSSIIFWYGHLWTI